MLSRQLVLLFVVLTASSCYRRVALVEALSSDNPHSKAYFLFPGNKNVSNADLEFRDISRHVHSMLRELGYRPAATAAEAGLLIVVMYGVSDPLTQRKQMTIPLTQHVPGKSYSVNATTNTSATYAFTGGSTRFDECDLC